MSETTTWRTAGPHGDGSDTVVDGRGRIVCALMPHVAHYAPQIVTAVNAHAALVEALTKAGEHVADTIIGGELLAEINAALSRAKP